jgi:hypothetical protein
MVLAKGVQGSGDILDVGAEKDLRDFSFLDEICIIPRQVLI